MRLLLDTNALLWVLADSPRLGSHARALVVDPDNHVYVSAASAWEIAIKLSLGRLQVPANLTIWLPVELQASRFTPLSIELHHAFAVEHLPWHHRDPFDRLLLAQATAEGLTLVTGDRQFASYHAPIVWCDSR